MFLIKLDKIKKNFKILTKADMDVSIYFSRALCVRWLLLYVPTIYVGYSGNCHIQKCDSST